MLVFLKIPCIRCDAHGGMCECVGLNNCLNRACFKYQLEENGRDLVWQWETAIACKPDQIIFYVLFSIIHVYILVVNNSAL